MSVTGVEVFYGDYQFKPAPLMTVSREQYKANDGTVFGGGYRVSINGSLLPESVQGTGLTPAEAASRSNLPIALGHQFDGYGNAVSSFRAKDDLLYALNNDGSLFSVKFLGDGPLCSGYVVYTSGTRVNSVEFSSEDQWVKKVEYSIEIFSRTHLSTGTGGASLSNPYPEQESYDLIVGSGGYSGGFIELQSYDRDYTVDIASKPNQFGTGCTPLWVTVGVGTSAQTIEGAPTKAYSTNPTSADFDNVVGSFLDFVGMAGGASGFDPILTERSHGINFLGGSYSWTDTYVMKPSSGDYKGKNIPSGNVIDTFNLDVSSSLDEAIITVNLQGELRGLESFVGTPTESGSGSPGPFGLALPAGNKMSTAIFAAQSYLDDALYANTGGGSDSYPTKERGSPLLFDRAATAYSGLGSPSTTLLQLSPEPISKSIAYNTNEGTIGYNLSYSNRPVNCYSEALSETISISRGLATDVHSSLVILGRANGPILQDIGTKTASTTECSIEAVVVPQTGYTCTGDFWVGAPTEFYQELIDSVEVGIADTYGTYFLTANNINWDPRTGRLGRTASWIHTDC
jgi:hypothetical protein